MNLRPKIKGREIRQMIVLKIGAVITVIGIMIAFWCLLLELLKEAIKRRYRISMYLILFGVAIVFSGTVIEMIKFLQ